MKDLNYKARQQWLKKNKKADYMLIMGIITTILMIVALFLLANHAVDTWAKETCHIYNDCHLIK